MIAKVGYSTTPFLVQYRDFHYYCWSDYTVRLIRKNLYLSTQLTTWNVYSEEQKVVVSITFTPRSLLDKTNALPYQRISDLGFKFKCRCQIQYGNGYS